MTVILRCGFVMFRHFSWIILRDRAVSSSIQLLQHGVFLSWFLAISTPFRRPPAWLVSFPDRGLMRWMILLAQCNVSPPSHKECKEGQYEANWLWFVLWQFLPPTFNALCRRCRPHRFDNLDTTCPRPPKQMPLDLTRNADDVATRFFAGLEWAFFSCFVEKGCDRCCAAGFVCIGWICFTIRWPQVMWLRSREFGTSEIPWRSQISAAVGDHTLESGASASSALFAVAAWARSCGPSPHLSSRLGCSRRSHPRSSWLAWIRWFTNAFRCLRKTGSRA